MQITRSIFCGTFSFVNGETRNSEVRRGLQSVLVNFLLSRLLIFVCVFVVAPHIPLPRPEKPNFRPSFSWSEMNQWDGKWYEKIATTGYEYQPDGRPHNITFFPLYPALVWLVMRTGLGFAAAGTIVSNAAFIAALYLLYRRTAEYHGHSAAQWAVAAMAWFPLSLFCFVTYSEAVFLLVTLGFLQVYEKERYWLAAFLAALAAICRVPGITIVPPILIFAYVRRLPWRAYIPAVAACLALTGFLIFQDLRFHDPLAFARTQELWEQMRSSDVLRHIYRPNNFFRVLAWPVVAALLWSARRQLFLLDLLYAGFYLALILYSRRFTSIVRFMYGIVPVFIAAGIWLSKRPRFATAAVMVSAVALSLESVAWAWDHFVG